MSRQGASKADWIAPNGALRIEDTAIELSALFAEVDRKLELTPE